MRTLLPLSRCAAICGLDAKEMIVGAQPRAEHLRLAARYRRCSDANKQVMRSAMVQAIRAALQRSAFVPAAELLTALRMMLAFESQMAKDGRLRSRSSRRASRQPLRAWPEVAAASREAKIYSLAEWRRASAAAR
jgi:hypothetical protein